MAKNDDYVEQIYRIPDNFVDSGRIINGMFRTRFFIEGCIYALIGFFIVHFFRFEDTTVSITVHLIVMMPLFLLGVFGLNDQPLSMFVLGALHWRKKKAVYFYNGKPRNQKVRPVDKMMLTVTARDKLVAVVAKLKASKEAQTYDYVEGVDYVFREDLDRKAAAAAKAKKKAKQTPAKKSGEKAVPDIDTKEEPTVDVAKDSVANIDVNDLFSEGDNNG